MSLSSAEAFNVMFSESSCLKPTPTSTRGMAPVLIRWLLDVASQNLKNVEIWMLSIREK